MKEKLYTIPLNDALNANDECPFCHIERNVEQDLLDYVLGSQSSYMEADIRSKTDEAGFCREHIRKMYDYGNTLGNAWILKTHYRRVISEMNDQFKKYSPAKISFKDKLNKASDFKNPISKWINGKDKSCFICKEFDKTYDRYLDTFFILFKEDTEFRNKVMNGKGFCLHHFGDLLEYGEINLTDKEKTQYYPELFKLMNENMERVFEDVAWLIEKYDYQNQDAPWKNSKDAVGRGMQKLRGSYPADPPYKARK